jgi:hypothetical protein
MAELEGSLSIQLRESRAAEAAALEAVRSANASHTLVRVRLPGPALTPKTLLLAWGLCGHATR